MAEDANPATGADKPLSLREAATQIKVAMQEPKPQAKQPDQPAKEANSQTEPEAKPPAAEEKEPEPRAEPKPQPKEEGADVEESEPSEAEPSEVELADTPEGLAEQLGVSVEQLMEHLKVKVKNDGVERQVNLKELTTGFQLESDYRNKTKALAEESRQAQETVRQAALERQQYAQYLVPLIQNMQAALQEEAQHLQALVESDPGEYLRQKVKFDQKQQALQIAQQEQQAINHRQQQEFQALQARAMAESERKLLTTFPEWKGEKGREEIRSLRAYAKERGVNAEAADRFFEAPFFELLHDAREYRKGLASKPAALKKVLNVPKVQGVGAASTNARPEGAKLRVATDRLRKTGHIRDAVPAMKLALKKAGIT